MMLTHNDVLDLLTLIAAITSAIVAVIGALKSYKNGEKVQEVHTAVNGQSERLQQQAAKVGELTGTVNTLKEQVNGGKTNGTS